MNESFSLHSNTALRNKIIKLITAQYGLKLLMISRRKEICRKYAVSNTRQYPPRAKAKVLKTIFGRLLGFQTVIATRNTAKVS